MLGDAMHFHAGGIDYSDLTRRYLPRAENNRYGNSQVLMRYYTQAREIEVVLRTCLVSFKNYLQEGQYNHLKTAVKGTFTVFPKSPTFV